jgi:hypothetical protein
LVSFIATCGKVTVDRAVSSLDAAAKQQEAAQRLAVDGRPGMGELELHLRRQIHVIIIAEAAPQPMRGCTISLWFTGTSVVARARSGDGEENSEADHWTRAHSADAAALFDRLS